MNTDDLQAFCRVAQLGSIAAAARAEASEASTVSRKISALEAQLGTRLFQRSTRKLALTEAGTTFLARIVPILNDLDAARDATMAMVERPAGLLRITASNSFGQAVVAPLLTEFCKAYPAIEIDLYLTDTVVDLVAEQVDVAVRLGPRPSGDLIISRLRSTERRLVASRDYLASTSDVAEPADILSCACLSTSRAPQQPPWRFQKDGESLEFAVHPKIRTANTLALRQLVRDGLGISLLPDWLVDEDIRHGRLVQLLPSWRPAVGAQESAIWAAYPSRSYLPLKTRKFLDHLRQNVR